MRFGWLLILMTSSGLALRGADAATDAGGSPATPSAAMSATTAGASATTAAAVPTDADIATQQQAVRSLFKTDYANKDPAKRIELAQKLIQLSATGTSAERIALLREAIAMAGSVGDLDLAHSAYDTIVQNWAVDADGERLLMYKGVVVGAADQAESATNDLLAASEAAITADSYANAQKLAEAAGGFARKADDEALAKRAKTAADVARDLGSEYYRITDNADMLGNLTPAQTAALGRFYALSKCDWTRALPMLANGDDATLKALATDDLAAASGPDHEAIGERWIDYAKKVTAKRRPAVLRRALDQLTRASDLSTGLAKAKIDKRIDELQGQAGNAHGGLSLPPGVVLWLSGEAGPDGQTIVDSGPSHLPLQVDGKLQLLREGHGGFMRFSGDEVINVKLNTPIAADSPLTITCWVRYAGKAPRGTICSLTGDGSLVLDGRDTLLVSAALQLASKQQFCEQTTVPGVKAWHHVAFVFDPAKGASWYIDGMDAVDWDKPGPLVVPIQDIQIGVGYEKLIGDMDSFGIWRRAFGADEVKAMYGAGKGGRPALP